MKLTDAMRKWAIENKKVDEDADDKDFTKAISEALVDESLSADEFATLGKDPDAERGHAISDKLDTLAKAAESNANTLASLLEALKPPKEEAKMKKVESGVTAAMLSGNGGDDINVISADKQYDATKRAKTFPMIDGKGRRVPLGGQPMFEGGVEEKRYIDDPSQLERAATGAIMKHFIAGPLIAQGKLSKNKITDHDRELFQWGVRNLSWGGSFTGEDGNEYDIHNRKLKPAEIKAVLDESNGSQGLEIVPIVFDDMVITTPLLHSEFYPRTNIVNINRGRRVEGAKISNPTITWNATEATAIVLETTDAFVSAFDTNIMTATGAIAMGNDFLSDTPVNFLDIVTSNAGQAMLNEFDDVIVAGNGTSEPTGIHDQGTAVAFSAAWTVGKLAELALTVGKEYKAGYDINRIAFGMNTVSYGRIRGLATGVTGDTRLVFGESINAYTLFGHPALINSEYGNAEANFVNLARYRLYRRLGITTRVETGGQTLALANQTLLIFRARIGGQLEDTSACAYTDSGQA